jgi:hypothetical protein
LSAVVSDDALRVAVEWLVNSLAAGTSEEEVASHLAPRMRRQGDMVLALSRAPRFAVFREHRPVIERIDVSGQWMALAQVSAGSQRWGLEVVLQPEPPHLIRLPSPRQADSLPLRRPCPTPPAKEGFTPPNTPTWTMWPSTVLIPWPTHRPLWPLEREIAPGQGSDVAN